MVIGLPGSGKSFFAQKLADMLGATHLSSDLIRKTLFDSPTYSSEEKDQVYQEMVARMVSALSNKEIVVLDSTFYQKRIRSLVIDTLSSLGIAYFTFHIQADEKLIKERTSKKRADSDADFEVYLKLKALFEPIEEAHLPLISTNENIDEMLEISMNYLAQ